jgi:hypothetical protein
MKRLFLCPISGAARRILAVRESKQGGIAWFTRRTFFWNYSHFIVGGVCNPDIHTGKLPEQLRPCICIFIYSTVRRGVPGSFCFYKQTLDIGY